ncbi:MAG TPA: DUF2207 domain-containing protein, partial [Candidatus Aminicenantes bacterium]|nr:DUF2207 domain-containing protein [Candidatus Aminicenantes bacterium]
MGKKNQVHHLKLRWLGWLSWGLLLLISLFPQPALGKNFYFPQVKIEIHIQPDGSFIVDEFRTYEFEGSFSWASLWIPLRVKRQTYSYNLQIENFSIKDEQSQPLPVEVNASSNRYEAKWFYQAQNQRRTFHIHYRVQGGIFSYPDVSELYWQVIGSGWDKPTAYLVVNVYLPQPVSQQEDILVYGHGPLSGRAEIVDLQTARFTATNIPAYQMVEIRMVWPAGLVQGIPSKRHTKASIQAEEARFVEETVAQARQAQEQARLKAQRRRLILRLWLLLLVLGTLGWLVTYLKIWKKIGQEYQFEGIPEYFREPPSDLPPALVEVLLGEGGKASPRAFTATVFDLARRGLIGIEDTTIERETL